MNKRTELRAMLSAVDMIAEEMKKKLRAKAREGYSGGLHPYSHYMVSKLLMEHAERLTGMCHHCHAQDGGHDREDGARQAVDVCNLAMMLWVMCSRDNSTSTTRGPK